VAFVWRHDAWIGCPMDQQFLSAAGIGAEEFKQFVATGATDQQVSQWIHEHDAVAP
jgi:hypothetical protein